MHRWQETLAQDVRFALRSFRRSPAFLFVALLSLTLGIGATTAIFSVIYGVIIAPYPYAKPGEIWAPEIRALEGRGGHGFTLDEIPRLAGVPAFADVMATSWEAVVLSGEYSPEVINGVLLTGNAFNFLGVPPVLGRTLQPTDVRADGQAEPVVVLSHRLWLRLFEGDAAALGRTLRLNGRPHTVVGVMPPRFGWYGNDGVWLPLSPARTDLPFANPIVRLAPGVSESVANEQFASLMQQLAREYPARFPKNGFNARLRNYLDVTVASGEMRTSLQLLLGAVGFLLLIACANVANLQLARGTTRSREMAVRMSIGAGRRRLIRQLLTESVLLSLAGGVLGVLFAFAATRSIVSMMPEFYVPNEARVVINIPVLIFSFVVSVVTGVAFGLAPALQISRTDAGDALRAGRGTAARAGGGRTRTALVVIEVMLSVVLLVSAGLTARTLLVLQTTNPGIDPDRVLLLGVPLPAEKYATLEQRNRFGQQLLERVSALPGVQAASFGAPFGGPQSTIAAPGQAADDSRRVTINLVGEAHLRTYGIALLAGRMFDASEVARGDRVAVINEAALKLLPAGENPVGMRLRLEALARLPLRTVADTTRPPDVTIVGVIANTRNAGLRNAPNPAIALPYSVIAQQQRMLALRASGDPNLLLNPVRAQVREMDADQPLGRPITVSEILDQEILQPRFTMVLFAAFAALGLALAAAGLYSVLSFHVTSRTQELGVRMALGAPRAHVLGLMLRMGGRLVLVGLILGIAASLASTRLLRSQLFGVQPADPFSYAAVIIILAAVALLASYIPARRAASVDPIVALRQE
ncbi:MAG TPA: ABC transporter permease [Vicinamibacterales bacterium]|nr:ABC transporter permease [Vicinamibacterales bacterium]